MWNWSKGKRALELPLLGGSHHRPAPARRLRPGLRPHRADDPRRGAGPADAHPSTRPAGRCSTLAARHHGVGTLADLTDYHRLNTPKSRAAVARAGRGGHARAGRRSRAGRSRRYLHRDAHLPRWVRARALLSPFDPVVWFRPRTEWLFDFHYRIEIYVPKPKRVYGYYVLPFLLGDRLVARVDLKADRQASTLLVQAAYAEPWADPDEVAPRCTRSWS